MAYGASHLVVNNWKLPKIINEKGDVEHVEIVSLLFLFFDMWCNKQNFYLCRNIQQCHNLKSKIHSDVHFLLRAKLMIWFFFLKLGNKFY